MNISDSYDNDYDDFGHRRRSSDEAAALNQIVLRRKKDEEAALLMNQMVLFGGSDVGHNIKDPNDPNKKNFVEINGEKVVCVAQGGECRQYGEYYHAGGLNNSKSWVTPIASRTCDDSCPYKYLVCDDHEHDEKSHSDDEFRIFIPYPQYNKFRGQFTKYCKDFDRIKPKSQIENFEKAFSIHITCPKCNKQSDCVDSWKSTDDGVVEITCPLCGEIFTEVVK